MRLLAVLLLVLPAIAAAPTTVAHTCAGNQADCVCPVPDDGEYHSHAGPGGSCAGGPEGQAAATPGGASVVPAWGVLGALSTLAIVALATTRAPRRR